MVRASDDILIQMESGASTFLLRNTSNGDAARTAMERAAAAVFSVPHPDDPSMSLPNFASEVTETPDGLSFWIDCKDLLDDDPDLATMVLAAIVGALDEAGVDGLLTVTGPGDED